MGSVNIDNTGSGADVTLSSDGTNLLLDGTAVGGGGGPDLFAENWNGTTTQPSATGVNAVAIGTSSNSTGTGALSGPHSNAGGDYSFAAAIGNSTSSYGSQGNNSVAFGQNSLSNGLNSAALGANAQAIGTGSSAVGQSYSSGSYAFAAAINNNTSSYGATGAYSMAMGYQSKSTAQGAVAFGFQATGSANYSVALGRSNASGADGFAAGIANSSTSYGATGANSVAIGKQNLSSGSYGLTIGGQANTSSGFYSGCLNTNAGTASQIYSTVINGYGTTADVGGKIAFGTSFASGWTRNPQTGLMTLFAATTDATATELLAQNTRVSLPNNSAYAFHGTIVAREQAADGTDCAAWKVEGLIRREGSASTTVLVNSATTVIDNTPSWTLALSADTTNGALKITGTGAAATNIRWVATIHTSEVTYA